MIVVMLIMSNVVRERGEKANRGKAEGNGAVGQEKIEKCSCVELFCHLDCRRAWRALVSMVAMKVREGRMRVDRRHGSHGLTSRAFRRDRSIPVRMWFWKSL